MSGTVEAAGLTTDVNASPSDIFDHLSFGIMGYAEAQNATWALALDGIYMDLSHSGSNDLEAGVQQGGVQGSVYRRLAPWAEIMVGGQLNVISASLKGGAVPAEQSRTRSWFDPVVGGRATKTVGRWDLSLQGQIGGFGVGSSFAWQLLPKAAWRATPQLDVILGYRIIDLDYTTDSGPRPFRYDMTTFGPQVGVEFRL